MKKKLSLRNYRATRLYAVGLLVGGVVSTACVDPVDPPPPDPEAVPFENGTIGNLDAAAHDPTTQSPFDATLSPDGLQVYFIALGADEDGEDTPGVFTVPAAGGTPTQLAIGAPLQGPAGIDITLDGATLLVADTSAEDEEDDGTLENGAMFSLSAVGGVPSIVAGTEGHSPSGVVVANVNSEEFAYFTGRDPAADTPGLFRIAPIGGVAETIASGAPFSDPGGVAVTKEGVAFVVDGAPNDPLARVIKVEDGVATVILDDIGVGYPAGIALSKDESVFLVSGIDPAEGTDTVYRVVVNTLEVTQISDPISAFAESAGLHRAHDTEAYAWADSEADGSGTVFVLTPPAP